LAAARRPDGARQAARALLVHLPYGMRGSLWEAWATMLLTGLLEAVNVAGAAAVPDGSALPVCSMATLRRWLSALRDGCAPDLVRTLLAGRGGDQPVHVLAWAVDAIRSLAAFRAGVLDAMRPPAAQAVIHTVEYALDRATRPPWGVSRGEWFAASWRAREDPHHADLWQLIADERCRRAGGSRPQWAGQTFGLRSRLTL
jgi:hypothetical protein